MYGKVIKTEISGKQWFYIQKRVWGLFWVYVTEMARHFEFYDRCRFETEQDADTYIEWLEEKDYEREQKKIVKTEYKKA